MISYENKLQLYEMGIKDYLEKKYNILLDEVVDNSAVSSVQNKLNQLFYGSVHKEVSYNINGGSL